MKSNLFSRAVYFLKNLIAKIPFMDKLISKSLIFDLLNIIAGVNLKKKSAQCGNIEECVDLAMNYKFTPTKLMPPLVVLCALQIRSEITQFIKLIKSAKPRVILEIGTANGGNLFLLSKIAEPNATIISVDLPVGLFLSGINYKSKSFFKAFASNNQKISLLQRDSHKASTLKKVKKILKNKKVDVLFIDGDHSYEGVKMDFKMYGPLVKENGIIAFHDIVVVTESENVNVHQFWNEIKNEYKSFEFVEDWNQGKCGIGVIFK